ncbi:hypothetical protein Aglo03_47980 [Actinokineospora globicatena]|uniref:Uncharacterized protein n=1 Tax=Actinokineospora globicatena TaxID=103729 RepID=A0A9W6QSV0_9PSEU|nr:hypothetical protein Aglo03_47980 [Actinokineospora globicatena]
MTIAFRLPPLCLAAATGLALRPAGALFTDVAPFGDPPVWFCRRLRALRSAPPTCTPLR